MPVTISLRLDNAVQQVENATAIGIRLMMDAVQEKSLPTTPKKEGNLRGTVSKRMVSNLEGKIRWNQPYAQYQERGMRADGTHVVRNYTTPGTGPHFVENAVNQVVPHAREYIRMGGLV